MFITAGVISYSLRLTANSNTSVVKRVINSINRFTSFSYQLVKNPFVVGNQEFNKMSSVTPLERIEKNAQLAETLISEIYDKIADIENHAGNSGTGLTDALQGPEISALRNENEKLKEEVAKWKELLLIRQIRNGASPIVRDPLSVGKSTEVLLADSNANVGLKPLKESLQKDVGTQKNLQTEAPKPTPNKVDNKKASKEKKPAQPPQPTKPEVIDIGRLDLRVGKIVEVSKHPDADTLYLEKIDVGEANPRTVVSGLVKFIPLEEMKNRMVVCLCNLKPAKMRGITSEAMVMCASTPTKVEVLAPPEGAVPGDLIEVEGFTRNPDPVMNPKKKIFETVAPDLKTNADKAATYKGVVWTVPGKGNVVSQTLTNVIIK